MSIRDRQIEATRVAILDAFLDLTHETNAVAISIPAVAERASVSIRTVYRHFPTKDDLQSAAAFRMSEQILRTVTTSEVDTTNVAVYLKELWSGFAAQIPAVIAEHTSPAGRDLRRTRLDAARRRVEAAVPSIDEDSIDLAVAVTSSSMFLELVERMGHTPEHAAALAARLVDLIRRDLEDQT